MKKALLSLVFVLALAVPMAGQANPPIQGVWRSIELTITGEATARMDPFDAFPVGTHTNLQPQLMIFTARHFSRTSDTAAHPRPTTAFKVPGKPSLEELQERWGPFAANAGTYELSGNTLTLRAVVAKNPRLQGKDNFARLTVRLDGNSLWLTPIETSETGRIPAPVTIKFMRVE